MASSDGGVAVLNPAKNPFDKIHKLYETANRKIVKNDYSEFQLVWNLQFEITVEQRFQIINLPPPPLPMPIEKKKSKRRKNKGPERTNHLVKPEKQIQQAHNQGYI